MAIYTSSSIKETIGRIIRNTGLQDTRIIAGFDEWIPEAMGLMKTKAVLSNMYKDVDVEFNKAPLPCGLRTVQGVAYKGERMRYYRGIRQAGELKEPEVPHPRGTAVEFQASLERINAGTNGEHEFVVPTIVALMECAQSGQTYYTELNWLNTSFAYGKARVFYNSIPLDEDELPLIPDNENYKQALYWYVRGQMIGAGYVDSVFKYGDCDSKFWFHAAKAKGEIRYPSPDQVETTMEFTRLISPMGYFESFYANPGQEQRYL